MSDNELKGRLGARIRQERERRGLNQRELAERLGIAPERLSRIETGQRGVDTLVLRRASQVFELPMDAFFDEGAEVALARRGDADDGAMASMVDWARRLQRLGTIVERESAAYG